MTKLIIGILEILVLCVSSYCGYQWTQDPEGNYEPWLFLLSLIFIGLEVFRRYELHFIKREGKNLTPGELVNHREEFRKLFKEEIYKCRAKNLRKDIIIRHVNRMDSYPEVDENSKGISPWFKSALLDTYHKGIFVWLRSGTLTIGSNGYCFTNHKKNEKGNIKVLMIGKIPYEYIEGVNFDGDEYYSFPHVFCHFVNEGEPYEEVVFCEEIDTGNGHYYKEIVDFQTVQKNSMSYGIKSFD